MFFNHIIVFYKKSTMFLPFHLFQCLNRIKTINRLKTINSIFMNIKYKFKIFTRSKIQLFCNDHRERRMLLIVLITIFYKNLISPPYTIAL
jgi:hypothetical protein